MNTVQYDPVYFDCDGNVEFNEESAVIELLAAGVLFVSGGYMSKSDTLELMVICNDLFYWATADAEPCKPAEVRGLYDAWKADPHWGVLIWCALHRQLQPQQPMRKRLQADGVWTDELAALADPGPS